MSVLFNVRRIDPALVAVLREDDSLVAGLCDMTFDFDVESFILEATKAMSPERAAEQAKAIRALPSTHRKLAQRDEARAALVAAGVRVETIARALGLGRSWWGWEAIIANDVGKRIVDQASGESLGDDVGYGPAQLFLARDLSPIADVLMGLTRDVARQRFVAFEAADQAEKKSRGLDVASPSTEEDFDQWSWEPMCQLRLLVSETARAGDALLRWYD